jgi:hypothetical protein
MTPDNLKIYDLVKLTESLYAITLWPEAISWSAHKRNVGVHGQTKVIISHSCGTKLDVVNDGPISDSFAIPFYAKIHGIITPEKSIGFKYTDVLGSPNELGLYEMFNSAMISGQTENLVVTRTDYAQPYDVIHDLLAKNGLRLTNFQKPEIDWTSLETEADYIDAQEWLDAWESNELEKLNINVLLLSKL